MKKILSLILCLAVVMAIGVSAFAFDITRPGLDIDTDLDVDIDSLPTAVKNFHYLVEDIGDVTLEDKEAIEAAEEAYAGISAKMKMMYSIVADDYAILQDARDEYDRLLAAPNTTAPQESEPTQPADPVDPNGDGTFLVIALAVLSMTALVVLVSKKRAF